MAIVNAWLCYETSTTTGTGAYTLSGTPFDADRTTFANVINDQDQVVYVAHGDGDNFEVNEGTWTAAGNTLSRDTILFSTNGGAAINWGAGTKGVYAIQEPLVTTGFLESINNLSDVQDVATARNNLGALSDSGNAQTIAGRALTLLGEGPQRFIAEETQNPGRHAWYGYRPGSDKGVIAHNDGTTERDIISFDESKVSIAVPHHRYISVTMQTQQTSNLAAANHVEFDTVLATSGDISLSTGPGQNDGIFTLPSGTWRMVLNPTRVDLSDSSGSMTLQFVEDPQSAATPLGGGPARLLPPSSISTGSFSHTTEAVLETTGVEVAVNIIGSTNVAAIGNEIGVTIVEL